MPKKRKQDKLFLVECPYCGRLCERVTGAVIYPHRPDLRSLMFYRCEPCGAYVGTHKNSGAPLGLPANHALRRARHEAHAAFDPLWIKGPMHRKQAYEWLGRMLGLKAEDTHIGHFNIKQCRQVVQAVAEFTGDVPAKYRGLGGKFAGDYNDDAARATRSDGSDRESAPDDEAGGPRAA